ncbi:cob(II)yrinic acid a,c-diamide reductase [Jatrophihabitans endophyticus]|uniref:Cob(II)yrinic acid a,c-diamide reductase n=1 Tax=Jatrophihabitans endophyticus TaxID=1206085 RepID=A0A1M5Q7A2_9ACTN|nr:5,6-dimethylbenzimidazole synthase [Jatrophihabitans endophyticus]SHH10077.1 cob(II)yrinic acid a,c-diamide reductase [Jatrophihabitans endophyticus]
MTWPRPVPTVGDPSSAAERRADPTGWALGADVVAALHEVVAARRDVRRFRPDDVAPELLEQVLAAGHRAPSVGHSQPWRFVVVREQATRDRAAGLADRERLRQAEGLTPDRRARLLDLQLEGIREAPVGVVVACDRRAAADGVLGRATFPDTDLWSCACAIQNIWLAARAAGLGLGWVTLFRPIDLAGLLGLPDGVETLGWLCLGWPDERPPEPGLERRGWSQRVPLADVVLHERWPAAGAAPEPPPSYLAAPDPAAVVAARDTGDDLLAAPGSLGVLDATIDRVVALPGADPVGGTLVLAAGDHPVAGLGVSAYPASVTADVLAATAAGESLAAVTARAAGLRLVARHAVPTRPQGDLLHADALHPDDVATLLADGVALGREAAAHGLVCLGEVGIGNTTVAAALACALLDRPAAELVGLGAGADTAMVRRKTEVVAGALDRVGTRAADAPAAVLAALGGPEFALLTGVVLGAAGAGVPVVLDGLATSVAALLAVRTDAGVRSALVAGQRSRERGHAAILVELGLEPLLDLRLRAGEGVGACLAAQALRSGLAVRRAAGRTR